MTHVKSAALAILVALVIALPLTGCGGAERTRFNAWISACMAEGGHVSLTNLGENGHEWWECFRDDQIIQVPGFDGED